VNVVVPPLAHVIVYGPGPLNVKVPEPLVAAGRLQLARTVSPKPVEAESPWVTRVLHVTVPAYATAGEEGHTRTTEIEAATAVATITPMGRKN
jgi:hypothetical protein